MRIFSCILFCFTLASVSFGQQAVKPMITVNSVAIEGDSYSERDLVKSTRSMLSKKFLVTQDAPLKLDITAYPGKFNTINGMDTYTVSEVEMNYTITLSGNPSETKTLSVKCKGQNEKDLQRKIGTTISRDKATRTDVIAFIDEYMTSKLGTCQKISSLLDQQISKGELELAYASLAYYDTAEDCAEVSEEKEIMILDAISAKTCKSIIQQAEVLANGATINDLSKATDKLLMVSPDSPCQDDVVRIAQLVSTNAKELGATSSKDIIVKLDKMKTTSSEEWRQYYRELYNRRSH